MLWTLIVVFVWFSFLVLLFQIVADVFRRRDMGGGKKVAWLLFALFLPFVGVFTYIVTQNEGMGRRNAEQWAAAHGQADAYADSRSASGEIERAKALLDGGAITEAEYESLKAKALG